MASTPQSPSPRIEHLGEAGILARLLPGLAQGEDVELGPGDDAAVLRLDSPRLVVTTDTLTEGQDFLLGATRPEWIGVKAGTQNLADVAAMGARPQGVVVSVSAPAELEVSVLEGISAGLAARCAEVGASVIGGDLGAADALSITVTALGSLPEGRAAVRRDGARPGDVLAIGSPLLGRSAAGLAWILAGHGTDPAGADVIAWHNAPRPDLALGWQAASGAASAMIDVSDGLSTDGTRIAAASGVVLDLDRAALEPDAQALAPSALALAGRLGEQDPSPRPWSWVLHGGEEHALLATFHPDRVPAGFRLIGRVRAPREGEAPGVLLGGEALARRGWDHFA